MSSLPVESVPLDVLWRGIEGVLAKEQGRSKETANDLLGACALAPGLDGRLWPCDSAFRSDERTREQFARLIPSDKTFLAREGIPLLEQLCPEFTVEDAIEGTGVIGCRDSWRKGKGLETSTQWLCSSGLRSTSPS